MKRRFDPFSKGIMHKIFVVVSIFTGVAMLVPFFWMVVTSLMPNTTLLHVPPEINVSNITFENYFYVLKNTLLLRWLLNSFLVSSVTAVLTVYIAALCAYPLAKKKFPGVKLLFWVPIAFMTIPGATKIIPLFLQINKMGLTNNYLALILPLIAGPYGMFLMKQMIQTVPNEMIEAAKIDGCNELGIFHRIILPVIKPAIGALLIFAFVGTWNDFLWQLIILRTEEMRTVTIGLTYFIGEKSTDYGYMMAAATTSALPIFIFFLLFQKYFVSGLTVGSVKG